MVRSHSTGNHVIGAAARDKILAHAYDRGLQTFAHPLPGVKREAARACLVRQLVDSTRRVRYVGVLLRRPLSDARADPAMPGFDPIKGAIVQLRRGDLEEACWLV